MVIALLPDQFQVDKALRDAVFSKYKNIAAENFDLSHPDTLIVNFCQTHDINCLDMLGQFQEQGKTRQLYRLSDSHWNEAGNRLAADLIFEYLEKKPITATPAISWQTLVLVPHPEPGAAATRPGGPSSRIWRRF